MHDPKAQDVIADQLRYLLGEDVDEEAIYLLDAFTDAGLVVVSDAAEPADVEQLDTPNERTA